MATSSADADMSELERLFGIHQQRPFPSRATVATAGLKSDLVAYDSHIAGCVMRLLKGERIEPSRLALNQALDAALDAVPDEPFIQQMKGYKQGLDELVRAARNVIGAVSNG